MLEFEKNACEYLQMFCDTKKELKRVGLSRNAIAKRRLELLQLIAYFWRDCVLLRVQQAGL